MSKTTCIQVIKYLDVLKGQLYIGTMKIRKAFKFKLKPTSEQPQKMAQTAGCVRFVWNKSLEAIKEEVDKKEG